MDMKNYNVDDILLEIKARKMREKAKAEGQPEKPDTIKTAAPAAQKPETRPRPEPKFEPKPKPVEEEFHLDFSPRVPEKEIMPAPKPERKREPERNPEPDSDTGAEIKPKKSVLKREPKPERAEKKVDGFRFELPGETDGERQSPLGLGAQVLPINERAKQRGPAPGLGRKSKRFEFSAEPFAEDGDGEIAQGGGMSLSSHDKTRVLPALSGIRDIKTGDIQKMDFDKIVAESQHGFYYDDEIEEESVPAGSVVDYSEYNSASDRRDVQRDIAHVKLWLLIRVSLTFILTAVLIAFTLGGKYKAIPLFEFMWPVEATMRMYFIACTAVTILVAIVNSSAVGGGLMGLFKMHANSDTLSACAILAAIGQGVVVVANPKDAHPGDLNLYFCIAALAMLFNAIGKMSMINRILANFRILASPQPKNAMVAVDSDEFCHEFIKDTTRRPVIAHSVKADFFTDFLGLSYSDKYDVGINRAVAPVCLVGAAIVGAITYFLSGSSIASVSSLAAVLCVCATLSSTFIENVPISKLSKKLTPEGGMVSGTKAVEDFCDLKAVVLTENDLFPVGHVQLHGIKAFPSARVDEAILDAASVLCAMDGALGPVFLDMIGGNKKLLRKVDNIAFENNMGISAWVDSRRILIGNRMLMQNHGISLPPEVAQQKQVTAESEPLFLSSSGEASAMFTVSYHIDEELALELDQLAHRGKLLIVYTTDANINAEKLWEIYGYPAELIRILPAEWHQRYNQMRAPRDKAIAEIVYTGKPPVMVKALNSCIAARSSILSATVIQLIQIILGYAFVTFLAFMGTISTLSVLEIGIYQLFWFIAIFIVQQARHS